MDVDPYHTVAYSAQRKRCLIMHIEADSPCVVPDRDHSVKVVCTRLKFVGSGLDSNRKPCPVWQVSAALNADRD